MLEIADSALGAPQAEVLGPRRLPHYGSPAAGAAAGMMGSMIGRMHYVVVDCPDRCRRRVLFSVAGVAGDLS
jgi:hypothetical protein